MEVFNTKKEKVALDKKEREEDIDQLGENRKNRRKTISHFKSISSSKYYQGREYKHSITMSMLGRQYREFSQMIENYHNNID